MVTNEQFMAYYLHKVRDIVFKGSYQKALWINSKNKRHPIVITLCLGAKRFVQSVMGMMDCIMTLKDHSSFTFAHGNRFLGKSKGFVFKMLVNLPRSGVELMKGTQVGGDMQNQWIVFEHVKWLKEWQTMVCRIYDIKCFEVLAIACCNMPFENGATQTLFWENLNVVRVENGVPNANLKVFMSNNAHSELGCCENDLWTYKPMSSHVNVIVFCTSPPTQIQ